MNHRTVLAITKRSAQFCGTQALLDASGLALLAAKNMTEARSVLKAEAVKGVIVCMHSWSGPERESIAAELAASHPELAVIVRCPGCTGGDEVNRCVGALHDTVPFAKLTTAKDSDSESSFEP